MLNGRFSMVDGAGWVQSKTNPHKAGKRGNCVLAQHLKPISSFSIAPGEKMVSKLYIRVVLSNIYKMHGKPAICFFSSVVRPVAKAKISIVFDSLLVSLPKYKYSFVYKL